MYILKKKNPSQTDKKEKLRHLLSQTITDNDGCMIWQGYTRKGSGIATAFSFRDYVHRHIYRFAKGRITKNQKVMRSCNKLLCANPDHLCIKSQDEMIKLISKRSSHARTLRANLSIVTDDICIKILELTKEGVPYKDIAKQFNVTRHRVSSIALQNGIRRNKSHGKNRKSPSCPKNLSQITGTLQGVCEKEKKDISTSG